MAKKGMDIGSGGDGSYVGHDEGTNRPPNAPDGMFKGGSTFAPLAGVGNTINEKAPLGRTGKDEGED